jgi:hypothetical protein
MRVVGSGGQDDMHSLGWLPQYLHNFFYSGICKSTGSFLEIKLVKSNRLVHRYKSAQSWSSACFPTAGLIGTSSSTAMVWILDVMPS